MATETEERMVGKKYKVLSAIEPLVFFNKKVANSNEKPV